MAQGSRAGEERVSAKVQSFYGTGIRDIRRGIDDVCQRNKKTIVASSGLIDEQTVKSPTRPPKERKGKAERGENSKSV